MPRIENTNKYPYDNLITDEDYLIGTDVDSGKATKSFKAVDLADYVVKFFNQQDNSYTLEASTDPNGVRLSLNSEDIQSSVLFQGTTSGVDIKFISPNIIKIGLPDNVSIFNNLVVGGNLTVNGTVTYLNTEELKVKDNIITLNSNVTGTPVGNAGIEIERGDEPNSLVLWNEGTRRWMITNNGSNYYNIPIDGEYNFYSHPTYTPVNLNGSGITFIKKIVTDSIGSVLESELGEIPSATLNSLGVTQYASDQQTIDGDADNLSVTPKGLAAALENFNTSEKVVRIINASGEITHGLNTLDLTVDFYDVATLYTVEARVRRVDLNKIFVEFDSAPINNIRAIIKKL